MTTTTVLWRSTLKAAVLDDFLGPSPKETLTALDLVNRRVAQSFGRDPKLVTVEWYYVPPVVFRASRREILGATVPSDPEPIPLYLLLHAGWRESFLHELVHIYNPNATEKQVQAMTRKLVRLLKNDLPSRVRV